MLAFMSQNMPKANLNDDTPMMKEIITYVNGGLVLGKNLDVLAFWRQHEKQFPLLAKVNYIAINNNCSQFSIKLPFFITKI